MSEEYPEFVEPLSPYCLVRARVATVYADGPDDGSNPDWRPSVDQKVVFTPSISNQLLTYDAGTDDPIIVTVEPVEATTNADGWFVSKTGEKIYLLATDDPRLSATGWTWTVNFNRRDIRFSAPSGGVVDLASFIAAPAVDATRQWVERIPELVDTIESAGTTASEAAAATVAARDTATGAATTATEQAGIAVTARTGAEAARDDAAAYAAGTNVQVGGRNLLLNSDFRDPNKLTGFRSVYGGHEIIDGRSVKTFNSNDVASRIEKNFTLNEVGTFTYSFLLNLPSSVTRMDWNAPIGVHHDLKSQDVTSDEFAVYSITFTNEEPGEKTLRAYTRNVQIGDQAIIEWEKLERGNHATDWTPAPEDLGVNPDTAQWAAPHSLALELADYAARVNVQVGGRNLLLNSATFNTVSSGDPVALPVTRGTDEVGNWITGIHGSSGLFHLNTYTSPTYELGAGTQFSDEIIPLPDVFTQSVEFMSDTSMTVSLANPGDPVVLEPGIWTRVSRTLTPSDASNHRSRMWGPLVDLTSDVPVGTKLYHRNWKVEKGNHATDWTPAPEDLGVNPDTAQWAAPHSLALELANAAALTIVGVGRPDIPATLTTPGTAARVAAATSGTEFRSIDGPQGAWEWQKRGSVWVPTQADTGWRVTYTADQEPETWESGSLSIRRIGDLVTLRFDNLQCKAGTGQAKATDAIPVGFIATRTTTQTSAGLLAVNYGMNLFQVAVVNRDVYHRGVVGTTTTSFSRTVDNLRGSISWITDESWPTTLTL